MKLGQATETYVPDVVVWSLEVFEKFGRGEWIRTTDLLVPNQCISTTYRHRLLKTQELHVFCLDPTWTLKANVWRTKLTLDPRWTLIARGCMRHWPA